jgi:hypothetical protein
LREAPALRAIHSMNLQESSEESSRGIFELGLRHSLTRSIGLGF